MSSKLRRSFGKTSSAKGLSFGVEGSWLNQTHELRIVDEGATWRIVYRLDADAVVIVDVFSKKTLQTPGQVIVDSRRRLRQFDELTR